MHTFSRHIKELGVNMDITYKTISNLYLSKGKNNLTNGKRTFYERDCKFCGKSFLTSDNAYFCCIEHGRYYGSVIEKFGRFYNKNMIDFIYNLHWTTELSLLQISKEFGWNRSSLTSYMCRNLIPHRTISQDNYRRYKHMPDYEIKEQTKAANKRCREIVKTGDWILCGDNWKRPSGKDCPAYKHGLTGTRGFSRSCGARYRAAKLNQTPDNANLQKIQLYYIICAYLNEPCEIPMWHVDHIKPISKGGLHSEDNLQILTAELNLQKSNKYPLTDEEQVLYKGVTI